jgi:hypothetical protein
VRTPEAEKETFLIRKSQRQNPAAKKEYPILRLSAASSLPTGNFSQVSRAIPLRLDALKD